MATIVNTIFSMSFDEMNDAQKAQAYDVMRVLDREDSNPWWAQGQVEQMKEELQAYGINDAEIYWSGFSNQGDGASISTDDIKPEVFLRKVRAWSKYRNLRKFITNDSLSLSVTRSGGCNYSHEYTVSGNVEVSYYEDVSGVQEASIESLQALITSTIRDLSRALYKSLEAENDYQNSDEAIKDSIEANDYHFQVDADGTVLKLA